MGPAAGPDKRTRAADGNVNMLKVAVIADDLTGAADTGVLFAPVVAEMRLLTAERFGARPDKSALSGVAISTDSRSMDSDRAGRVVADLAGHLKAMQPDLVYKKIDSCLRGHVGVELLRLMDACGRRGALVVPAYPRLGRATINDTHYVMGVPVAESEAGADPVRPVSSSLLSENLALGHAAPVGFVDISAVEGGQMSLAGAVRDVLDQGRRLIAVDAATDGDLDIIAATALEFFPDLVLSGSAGLAHSVAARLTHQAGRKPGRAAHAAGRGFSLPPRPALFVGGSASTVLRGQLEALSREGGIPLLTLEARQVLHGLPEQAKSDLTRALAENSLIICLSPPDAGASRLPSQELALALGSLAAGLVRGRSGLLGAVFASGGDTAQAVLHRLGNPEMVIHCELAPGFIASTLAEGPCAGLFFLTKSGSFGAPDLLSEVYNRLRRSWPGEEIGEARSAAP